jgi:uncharacterized protein
MQQKRATPPITACPTCREQIVGPEEKFWPFCSERCRLVDLGKWFNEDFKVSQELKPGELSADELSE